MKRRIMMILLAIILFTTYQEGQPKSIIERIRHNCQSIKQSIPKLRVDSLELPDWSTEGGIATAYRDSSGDVRTIVSDNYGEMGKTHCEFYFQNDSLICAVVVDEAYNVPPSWDSAMAKEMGSAPFDPNKSTIVHNSYFFCGNKFLLREGRNLKQVRKNSPWGSGDINVLKLSRD